MAGALDLRLKRLQLLSLAVPLSGNNLGQVVHTHVLLSPSSKFGTGQGAVMPCGWEGNRRSGVALAMRHRLQWFIHLRAQGLRKGDEHPAYSPRWVWHNLRFFCTGTGRQRDATDVRAETDEEVPHSGDSPAGTCAQREMVNGRRPLRLHH